MQRIIFIPAFLVSFACAATSLRGQEEAEVPLRETIFHHVIDLEGPIAKDIPRIPPLCDRIPSLRKRRVDVGDCELHVEMEGDGIPLVLINGGPGGTHHSFHPWFSRAAGFARVIYYDQRGCGLSDHERGAGYTVAQAVEDLDGLRERLGIERWALLGWSYGGLLAQRYLIAHPERALGLILVCASPALELSLDPTRQYEFLSPRERMRIQEIYADRSLSPAEALYNAHRAGDWKRQRFYKPTHEQLARMAFYEWRHAPTFRDEIGADIRLLDTSDLFHGCPVPILIAEGRWDLTWNTDKPAKLHGCFPGSRLILFEASAHAPFADEPDAFFASLEGFLEGLRPIAAADLDEWKRRAADREERRAAEAAISSDVVTFRAAERAPRDFDSWSFFWMTPRLAEGARLGYRVRSEDGAEYYRWDARRIAPGERTRSDFAKRIDGRDPSVLFGKIIVVSFWATRGEIEFPPGATLGFEFHRDGRAIARIEGHRVREEKRPE
ncbi:MAG: alpha/beta fold hydrolase [Planctomycetes bacterium]|nr:alpha/beta fold hydrolase [Planctomycetota bacterium]